MTDASIALHRFGLGARPNDAVAGDPRRWLLAQLDIYAAAPAPIAAAARSPVIAADLARYLVEQKQLRQAGLGRRGAAVTAPASPTMAGAETMAPAAPEVVADDAVARARQLARRQQQDYYTAAVGARATQALVAEAPFVERLVHFWANHFAVSADKLQVVGLSGTLEFEAIRPHVLGTFGAMLAAVERHPAMLLYLDQAQSVGPASPLGVRVAARGQRTIGLNENLAREIMELHTLGVGSGYTQGDVTEFARAMTGWTVAGLGQGPAARLIDADGAAGSFVFAAAVHEPGDRTMLGKRYPAAGEAQAQAVLDDLAAHPATARHLATKLARHFAGDTPPATMVARLEQAFLRSGGDLPTVYRAIVASPEAWTPQPVKFRTPWEWSIASYRALGATQVQPQQIKGLLDQLGQPTWKPGQPVGWDDIAGSWAGPDALMRRVEAAERLATRAGAAVDARALGRTLFPAALTPATAQALDRAESPGQALALLLVSPDMMRR